MEYSFKNDFFKSIDPETNKGAKKIHGDDENNNNNRWSERSSLDSWLSTFLLTSISIALMLLVTLVAISYLADDLERPQAASTLPKSLSNEIPSLASDADDLLA